MAKSEDTNAECGIKNVECDNAECRMQNAECDNAECRMQNAELDSDNRVVHKSGRKKVGSKSTKEKHTDGNLTKGADSTKVEDMDAGDKAQIESESDPLEVMQKELAVERDKYLRLAAEYDNYRKRSTKEREMIYTDARINAISKLLTVYDNLERALGMECADEAFYKGVEMIMTQMTEVMAEMGVEKIPAVGEPFDPNRHNAVMKIENPDLGENIIAEEYQKGFILGDRVIRFSTVVVAN